MDNREIFEGTVVELRPSGAIVRIRDNKMAWLPGREVIPSFKTHDDFRKVGKDLLWNKLLLVEIGPAFGRSEVAVSHIRVENDPWSIVQTWVDGDPKVMTVDVVTSSKALGIIDNSVRAEILLDNLDKILPEDWHQFHKPLPGDEVAGCFRKVLIDEKNRIVTLDYNGYVRSSISVSDLLLPTDEKESKDPDWRHTNKILPRLLDVSYLHNINLGDVKTVLVVDDDKSFADSLSSFLAGKGCKTITRYNEDDAKLVIASKSDDVDLAIIDMHLRGYEDYHGIEIIRMLQQIKPNCRTILMSADRPHDDMNRIDSFSTLSINAYITKPFGPSELFAAIDDSRKNPRSLIELLGIISESEDDSIAPLSMENRQSNLERILDEVRRTTNAAVVILYAVHEVTYVTEVIAKSDPKHLYGDSIEALDLSPIKNVALENRKVLESDVSDPARRPMHKYLLATIDYISCAGVRVENQLGDQQGYALFAFHDHYLKFDHSDLNKLKFYAREITRVFQEMKQIATLRQMKPFELIGKAYGSMAHDLQAVISNAFIIDNLEKHLAMGELEAAQQCAEELRERSYRAQSICEQFRMWAMGHHQEVTDFPIEDVIERVICRFGNDFPKVEIMFLPCLGKKSTVRMRENSFEQILYNLMTNADQQLDRLNKSLNRKGQIFVQVERQESETGIDWGIVRVYDNGPGIHRKDFDRIFDVHFSTKPNGCGMGLDICKSIVESVQIGTVKGTISVGRSIILAGTIFEVKLPLL